MGNRAVITTAPFKASNVGLYLHWNGGIESITGFCEACAQLGYRSPDTDSYGWASLAYAIGLFFKHDGLSMGIDKVSNLDTDNGDNGTWIINHWEIIGNKYGRAPGVLTAEERAKADKIRDTIIERALAVQKMP